MNIISQNKRYLPHDLKTKFYAYFNFFTLTLLHTKTTTYTA